MGAAEGEGGGGEDGDGDRQRTGGGADYHGDEPEDDEGVVACVTGLHDWGYMVPAGRFMCHR